MVTEFNYVSIREVISRIMRNPLLQDVTLEQVVQYTIDFFYIFGFPKMFQDKEEKVHIFEYRGKLPCDVVQIKQIKDCKSGVCLRSMTDNFSPDEKSRGEITYKTQGQMLYTSFKEGEVIISYNAVPLDEEGYPLLIDNGVFLKTLELYVKKEVFTILFDLGKISPAVLQNAQQSYAWSAGQLQSEMTIPSVNEMESIKGLMNQIIPRFNEFKYGFKHEGNKEYWRVQ